MQAAEIAVYIGAAVVIAGLLVSFLIDWRSEDTYHQVKNLIVGEDSVGYRKVSSIEFVAELHDIWEDCGLGEKNSTVPLYINGNGTLTKEFIFTELKKINYCGALQSAEFNCGIREDVEMNDFRLPSVVGVECKDNKMIIG